MKLLATAATLLAALQVSTAALHIESTQIAPPTAILGEHQELAKTWTVTSDEPLEKLHIAVAGPVVVRYDPALRSGHSVAGAPTSGSGSVAADHPKRSAHPDEDETVITPLPTTEKSGTGSRSGPGRNASALRRIEALPDAPTEVIVAKILISGNGTDLMSAVDVAELSEGKSNGLRVHLRNADTICEGYLLTQILVAEPKVLRHLVVAVASSVVAEDGVLITDSDHARVRLSTSGEGVVLVESEHPVELGHLDIDVTGKGVLQFRTPKLSLSNKLAPSIAGSGVIAVHTEDLRAREIETTLSGSGAMYVEAKHLDVDRLTTSVYGTANASFHITESGVAQEQKISVAGAGAVYAGAVVANETKVNIRGAAEVYVQVTDYLHVDASFSGDVYYVGKTPAEVKTSSWFWRTPVHAATTDKVVSHEVLATPKVSPTYVSIHTKHSLFSADPIVKHVPQQDDELNLQAQMPAPTQHAAASTGVQGGLLLVLGCVAVGATWNVWRQRNERRQYQPLL